jgi:hypothetical protein
MTVRFLQPYSGNAYPAGSIATLPASTEEALITARIAENSTAVPTVNVSGSYRSGRAVVAAGQSTTTVQNPLVNASTSVNCQIAQSVADATFNTILRVVPSAGSFQIIGNANATAAVQVAWDIGS